LSVRGLKIRQSGLSAEFGEVKVNLSPKGIFSGQINGAYLIVKNGHIQQSLSDTTTQDEEESSFLNNYLIHFQKIIVSHVDYVQISNQDTLSLSLADVLVSDLRFGNSIYIDSLINRGSSFMYRQNTVSATQSDIKNDSISKFSLESIPGFTINSLSFDGCDFNYITNDQQQTIKKFNLELTGLKDSDLLNATVSQISFNYQDSLDVNLNLGKITVNNQEETKIKQLDLNLPWLRLQIPQLELSNLHSPQVYTQFHESFINTALIRYFFPTIELPFSKDLNLNFDGAVNYNEGRIGFEQMQLQLENIASLNLSGFADLPDKADAGIQLDINHFQSSYSELAQLFDLPKLEHQKEISLNSDINISGSYSKLKAEGIFSLNAMTANFVADIEQKDQGKMNLTASLRSKIIDPSQVIDSLGVAVKFYDLQLAGQLALSQQSISGFSVKVVSDSAIFNEQHIDSPEISFAYDQKMTSADIRISDILKASVRSTDDILSNHFSFNGSIESHIPQLLDFKQNAGDFYTSFKAQYINSKDALNFQLALDTLRFSPSSSAEIYQSSALLTAAQDKDGEMQLNVSVDHQEMIRFQGSKDILDWWDKTDKWEGDFPIAELDLSVSIDSVLIEQFTGLKASLQLNDLKIRSSNNEIVANIDLQSFIFNDFVAKEFHANIEYSPELLESELSMASFQNPYANLEDTRINIFQEGNKKTGISLISYIPELQHHIELNPEFAYTDTSYVIGLQDNKNLRLGKLNWQNQKSKGFEFNHNFELISGELSISNNEQKISIATSNHLLSFKIDSLDLSPAGKLLLTDSSFTAFLSTSGKYNLDQQSLDWLVSVSDIVMNNIELGELRSEGYYSDSLLNAHLLLDEAYGKLEASVQKNDIPYEYHLDIKDLDVSFLNSSLSPLAESIPLSGQINAKLNGSYDTILKSTGYIGFSDLQSYLTDYKIFLNIPQDTLWFKNNILSARNFKISDQNGDILTLDGSLTLQEELLMDVSLKTRRFSILDNNSGSTDLKGKVDIASDLRIRRNQQYFSINGDVSVLPNSSLRYVYQSSVSIDERDKEITFVSFDTIDHPIAGKKNQLRQIKTSNPIQWDVNLAVGKSDVTIILSETAQDQIKMTTDGTFLLKTGDNDEPFFYGTLQSKEGSIIYDAPAVSDLNFTIENLEVVWSGELTDPKINFLGSEIFRVTPKGIPGMTNSNSVVPITVLAKVDDRPINDFTLTFDMNSNNAQVKSWIQSLPPDTREATAINLLLFGNLNFGETGGSTSYLQTLVGKMNEISRRNIKNADISFYVDNEKTSESTVDSKDKLGYSLSKNLFDKRVKISVGGSVDLSNSSEPGQKGPVALGNVQLDYIVSNSPEITLMLSQKSTYDGVINGQINESSAGITFQKSFRNFFRIFKKKQK
jgi:hypothetical protein